MFKKADPMSNPRIERVQSEIQHEIARIIDQELRNPNLPEMITITHVKVTRDLSEATVHVTFLHDESPDEIKAIIQELNRSAGHIRSLLAERVVLRRHPHLRFEYNPSTSYALGLESLFQKIKSEDSPVQEETADEEE